MFRSLKSDFSIIKERDPAARGFLEIILCYPGFQALVVHRISHNLWKLKLPFIPRILSQATRFLKAGDKVKCTVIFRGREIQHTAIAETLLKRMAKDLEEKAEVQQNPKREGRNMIMFLTPRKTPLLKNETDKIETQKAMRTIN